ncbi:MAG: hypothetical protein ABFC89_10875 [Methanospirillum sp.]
MPEDQITFRTDRRIKATITELVRQNYCRNISDFMNQAILLKLQLEQIPIGGELVGPEPMVTFFESPRGRALIKELIREVKESG